jgi:hypothetical protein
VRISKCFQPGGFAFISNAHFCKQRRLRGGRAAEKRDELAAPHHSITGMPCSLFCSPPMKEFHRAGFRRF